MPRNASRTLCPYLAEAFDECLCRDMRSENVAAIIRLCGGEFEACEIYRRRIESEKRKADGKEETPAESSPVMLRKVMSEGG